MFFASNPIIVTVNVGSNAFPSDSSNRRIKLKVVVEGKEYPFLHSAENGSSFSIDVSSAYRAELKRKSGDYPSPSSPSSPTVTGTCSIVGECVIDGLVTSINSGLSITGDTSVTARYGKYTDIQRYGHSTTEVPSVLSTKPSLMEVVKVGDVCILGNSSITAAPGIQNGLGNGKIYGEENRHRHQMLFLNQYGEVESVSVVSLETLSKEITSNDIEQVRSPRHQSYAKHRSYKTGGFPTWKMSSGNLEREWLQWFAEDFCKSSYHWIKTEDGMMLPVTIKTDNAVIYNQATGEIQSIDFTVVSCLEGVCDL